MNSFQFRNKFLQVCVNSALGSNLNSALTSPDQFVVEFFRSLNRVLKFRMIIQNFRAKFESLSSQLPSFASCPKIYFFTKLCFHSPVNVVFYGLMSMG